MERPLRFGKLPLDVTDQFFEPVQFEFIHQLELLAQSSFRKPMVVVPNDIIFGKINEVFAFVFAERHFGVREFDEEFLVVHF